MKRQENRMLVCAGYCRLLYDNSVSGKRGFLVPVLLASLLVTTTLATLNSSVYFASHGTILYSSFSEANQESELRGVLVKYLSQYSHDDDLICSTLSAYGINAVYVELNPFAWTGVDLDQFQSMIDACNAYGLSFHVLVKYIGYSPSYTQDYSYSSLGGSNPDWQAIDVNGNPVDTICLQRATTRARLKSVIDLMTTNFPAIVDINHDYVRYATTDVINVPDINYKLCYCDQCKDAFDTWLATNGKAPVSDADFRTECAYPNGGRWFDFAQWRVGPINNIIRDVRQWALAKNPNLAFSADTWRPYYGWTPDAYKYSMGQDPAYWISQGWLDSLNTMEYVGDMARLTYDIPRIIQYQTGDSKGAIPFVPFITQGGPGADFGSAVSISFWLQEIDYLRQQGCNGFIIWRYGGPGFYETGTPFTDITPYLAAIRDRTDGGKAMFPTFEQSSLMVSGQNIAWTTSLPTTGKVEYSTSPLFMATPIAKPPATYLPCVDMDYNVGTIVSETAPSTNHLIYVPSNPPFYFRIKDADSSVELAGPVYLVTG